MPIYEYACTKCDKRFEKLVRSMNDTAPVPCPACQSTQTERALSVFAVGAEPSRSGEAMSPMCGRCGGAPGSCAMGG